MPQYRQRNIAHIVGSDKVAPADRCQCFRTEQERDRSARASAVMNKRMRAGATDQINSVTLHAWFHLRPCNLHATMNDRLWIRQRLDVDLLQSLRIEPGIPACYHFALVIFVRIIEQDLELKAVKLRLR